MPKYKISATNAAQGGITIAEITYDAPNPRAAIRDGRAELLKLPNFPPEAAALYTQGIQRASNPAEEADVVDLLLEKFHVQFFLSEEAGPPQPALPPSVLAQQPPPQAFAQPRPPTDDWQLSRPQETPRRMLQRRLTELNREIAELRPHYERLISDRNECRRLLAPAPKPKGSPRAINPQRTTA